MQTLRPDIEMPPDRMAHLRIYRGFPVPDFVQWVQAEDGTEFPEFRCMDPKKLARAVNERLCWVCGDTLGRYKTFVAGPMCGINRNSAEPPCHLECARYSAKNCPFLSKPQFTRREGGTEGFVAPGGNMILRNPGVTMLWTCKDYRPYPPANGGVNFRMGKPTAVEWWALGQRASRAQVQESIRTGLPAVEKAARAGGAMNVLERMVKDFEQYLPG